MLFKIKERGSSVGAEVRAGLTTFLAMSYIVPVNASIMSLAGMPFDALVSATALVTMIASILNGLWSNTPIAMSVGMGLNAYFTFGLVKGMGMSWQSALGVVMISGLLFLALSLTRFRVWMLESLPLDMRRAISGGIGLFIAFIGLQGMGLIVANEATLVGMGDIGDPKVLLGVGALFLAVLLYAKRVRGGFLIAMLVAAVVAWGFGLEPLPKEFISFPASIEPIAWKFDIASVLSLSFVPVIITFALTDMFDTLGTLAGVGTRAKLFEKEPKALERTLEADALATVLGASFGTSTTTSFIESASGVEEGGRTGLTAVVAGALFGVMLFFAPLFKSLPQSGVYAILVMVGVLMFREIGKIDFSDFATALGSFLTVALMPLTYSITLGLSWGLVGYFGLKMMARRLRLGEVLLFVFGLLGIGLSSF